MRLLGLRDIIDEPRSIVKGWNEGGIYDAIRDFYDHVLVYGSQDVYDSTSLYEFPSDLVARTRYLNYVCDALEPEGASAATDDAEAPLVAVTIGGGDGGDEAVIQSYLEMLENFREEIDFRSEIIGGPLLSPERQRLYRDRARGLPVVMREFVDSTVPLFRRADLVVCTAGYNTSTQLLRNARRAIMIPRVLHRDEQLIRARRFEELGLVACMHPNTVTPARLLEEIRLCLGSTDEPLTRGRSSGNIPLDGSQRMVEFCSGLQVRCPSIARAADTGAFVR